MTATRTTAPRAATSLDEEQTESVTDRDHFEDLVRRLSRQSVDKHFDAYEDVDWDAPEMAIDPDDPRWELPATDPLGSTEWYQSQPAGVRSRIGLHRVATMMKVGLQFESILKRGLLEFAFKLPNGSPEYRYVYHEVIEEAQHSLMFQEFVNRTGIDVPGLSKLRQIGTHQVISNGRRFPTLFFFFVLGGEDPIDYVQRKTLREGEPHPLLERIMRIHVTEEARHLSFARMYLRTRVPRLNFAARAWLAVQVPITLGIMAKLMLRPSRQMVTTYAIPRSVRREAYTRNPAARADVAASLGKVRKLCEELGLVTALTRPLWKALKLEAPSTA